MSDNVNIIVQDTINEIVVNSAVTVETIDINVQAAVDEVTIIANPNDYIINVNRIIGEQVQSDWNETDINAPDFIKNKPIIPAAVTKTSDLINDGEDGINPFITLEDIPPVTGFVPYIGAIQDVNLGEFGIQLGNLEFDTTPTNTPTGVGSMVWNDTAGTLDLKLKGGNVTLQIGQETVARVVNKTATNIPLLEANYQVVRVTGAQGQRPKVDLALANNDLNSTTTLGLVTETILNNQEGFITTSGQVQGINTTGSLQGETWADGDVLYLSGTVYGQATNIKPIAPIHTVIIGFVEYAHITQGKIFVKVDNGYELEELHNVSAIAPNNNEVLTYDSATLLWKPKTVFQLPTLTNGSVLFSNGTTIAQDNSNFFWDDTNNRLGIGTNAPVARLQIITTNRTNDQAYSNEINQLAGSSNQGLLVSYSSTLGSYINSVFPGNAWLDTTYGAKNHIFKIAGVTAMTIKESTSNVLINTTIDQGGKLQIKAPGALSTDIALRVRNSADTLDMLIVNGLGNASIGQGTTTLTNRLTVQDVNATSVAIELRSDSNPRVGSTFNTARILAGYSSGTASFLDLQYAGGAFPYTYTTGLRLNSSGNVLINTTTDNGGKLQIKAPGALSTDIALRVRNSADTGDLFNVLGDGSFGKTTPTLDGTFSVSGQVNNATAAIFQNGNGNFSGFRVQKNGQTLIDSAGVNAFVNASAILELKATNRGFLPPRMTNAQRTAIATPAVGLCVYCTDAVEGLYINKSTGWTYIG